METTEEILTKLLILDRLDDRAWEWMKDKKVTIPFYDRWSRRLYQYKINAIEKWKAPPIEKFPTDTQVDIERKNQVKHYYLPFKNTYSRGFMDAINWMRRWVF